MKTLTEKLRAGLLAHDWARTDTKSGRECYTKIVPVINLRTGKRYEAPFYIWLGEAGSLRSCAENAFTKSIPVSPKKRQHFLDAGSPEGQSDAMLKELDK